MVDQGLNRPNTIRSSESGSELAKYGPFWSIRVKIGRIKSVLVSQGPNWPTTVRFGQSGSKLANYGPLWSIRVQIGQKQSVLVSLGQYRPKRSQNGACLARSDPDLAELSALNLNPIRIFHFWSLWSFSRPNSLFIVNLGHICMSSTFFCLKPESKNYKII